MPVPVVASPRLSGSPPWVLLEQFASTGYWRNATTAAGSSSAGQAVEVSFVLVDPPGVSRWFVEFPGLKDRERDFKRMPQLINAAGDLVLMRMSFFTDAGDRATDYFVYKGGGPGKKPSLDLVPGPCPRVDRPYQIGIVPCAGAGEHYFLLFPTPQFYPCTKYELQIFSSESRGWSAKVDPELRLLRWPVPPPRDDRIDMFSPTSMVIEMYSASSIRDATFSEGVIRFVQSDFDDNGEVCWGWTATIYKRDISSKYWYKCVKTDIAKILATDSSFSHLIRKKMWDHGADKLDLNKVISAPPKLSLQSENVVYFMTKLKSVHPEALLLAVNLREERLEAVELISSALAFSPCVFNSFVSTSPSDSFSCAGSLPSNRLS
ncbi:hypothetical protein ACP4OV_005228 [Aristida adscensionis]